MAENAREKRHTLDDLLVVMARLRDPERGCPWDVKQNFSTIAPYTIEEAYEVADAIARGDLEGLKDELGDLLLQVVYHAQMAGEQSRFDFSDVADAITRKMIRRHPHVFADGSLRDEFLTLKFLNAALHLRNLGLVYLKWRWRLDHVRVRFGYSLHLLAARHPHDDNHQDREAQNQP